MLEKNDTRRILSYMFALKNCKKIFLLCNFSFLTRVMSIDFLIVQIFEVPILLSKRSS